MIRPCNTSQRLKRLFYIFAYTRARKGKNKKRRCSCCMPLHRPGEASP
jgi:hypothetical protein